MAWQPNAARARPDAIRVTQPVGCNGSPARFVEARCASGDARMPSVAHAGKAQRAG
jgi:hypothetical protein